MKAALEKDRLGKKQWPYLMMEGEVIELLGGKAPEVKEPEPVSDPDPIPDPVVIKTNVEQVDDLEEVSKRKLSKTMIQPVRKRQ